MKNIIFTFITVIFCFVFTETLLAVDTVAPPPPLATPVEPTEKDAKAKDIREYSAVLAAIQHGEIIPIVTGFSPTSGIKRTRVTFNGSDLNLIDNIKFEDKNARVKSESETEIEVEVPDLGKDNIPLVQIIITYTSSTGNAGTATLSDTFSYGEEGGGGGEYQAPSITSYPSSGKKKAKVNFEGTNLLNVSSILFNNKAAKIRKQEDIKIELEVPDLGRKNLDNVTIIINQAEGDPITLTTSFTYQK